MKLTPLCDVELHYRQFASLDFGPDGQLFGTMEGQVLGEGLRGALQLTNLAPQRSDNVNLPTLVPGVCCALLT